MGESDRRVGYRDLQGKPKLDIPKSLYQSGYRSSCACVPSKVQVNPGQVEGGMRDLSNDCPELLHVHVIVVVVSYSQTDSRTRASRLQMVVSVGLAMQDYCGV